MHIFDPKLSGEKEERPCQAGKTVTVVQPDHNSAYFIRGLSKKEAILWCGYMRLAKRVVQ
jgi:hypothetical protein